jgi:hypothetical protein
LVSANTPKELPNVLPKGNPIPHNLLYDGYRSDPILLPSPDTSGEGLGLGVLCRTLTSSNRCKCDKNQLVATATTATFPVKIHDLRLKLETLAILAAAVPLTKIANFAIV